MPKLAIYVPKQEMREIDHWRKRINFSRVFMRALQDEIRQRSRTVDAKDDQLAAAARHYRQALTNASGTMTEFGFQLGSDDVLECRLSPESIHRLLEIDDPAQLNANQISTVEAVLEDQAQRITDFAGKHGYDLPLDPALRDAVYRGYVQGVVAAWKQVCHRMQSIDD